MEKVVGVVRELLLLDRCDVFSEVANRLFMEKLSRLFPFSRGCHVYKHVLIGALLSLSRLSKLRLLLGRIGVVRLDNAVSEGAGCCC